MSTPHCERLLELLADRAVEGLTEAEAAELAQIERELGVRATEALEATAGEVAACAADEPLPASLRARLETMAAERVGGARPALKLTGQAERSGPMLRTREGTSGLFIGRLGWVAAAACLLLAAVAWMGRPGAIDPARERREILAAGVGTWAWSAWTPNEIAGAATVQGDVVWSGERQGGVMRFAGLPANPAGKSVYQLWIIDAERPDEPPVDGGVFTVEAGQREVLVPFRARVRVGAPAAFAVTEEKPGGVIVSKQERRVVIATPPRT